MGQEVTTIETLKERIVPKLKHFVDSASFGFTIMLLILLSVALIVIESFVDLSPQALDYVRFVNDDILLWIFIVELLLRWIVSPSTKFFLSNYWIDILAVVPVSSVPIFRILRLGRVLRILRVLRLFFKDLLSRDSGNTLNFILATLEYAGKNYSEIASELHEKMGYTLVGIKPYEKRMLLLIPRMLVLLVIAPVRSGGK